MCSTLVLRYTAGNCAQTEFRLTIDEKPSRPERRDLSLNTLKHRCFRALRINFDIVVVVSLFSDVLFVIFS